jgi:hypothetical protein
MTKSFPLIFAFLLAATTARGQVDTDKSKAFVGIWEIDPSAGMHMPHAYPFFRKLAIETTPDGLRESMVETSSLEDDPGVTMNYPFDGSQRLASLTSDRVLIQATLLAGELSFTWRGVSDSTAVLKRVLSISTDQQVMTMKVYSSNATSPSETYILKRLSPSTAR